MKITERLSLIVALVLAAVALAASLAHAGPRGVQGPAGPAGPAATATVPAAASLPAGVTPGPRPGTYYVDCFTAQCTGLPGAGPFGTTCGKIDTGQQLCQ